LDKTPVVEFLGGFSARKSQFLGVKIFDLNSSVSAVFDSYLLFLVPGYT
jgi:hypothetical protein